MVSLIVKIKGSLIELNNVSDGVLTYFKENREKMLGQGISWLYKDRIYSYDEMLILDMIGKMVDKK